ncbi:MAG: SCO family protein, partial [Candidatus Methylomirabilaceae bacterium]
FCPVIAGKMGTLQRRLKQQGVLGRDVVLLSASFDPEKDTLDVLRRYAKTARAEPGGWFFLRGDDADVSRLVQDYDVWVKRSPDGSFDHSMRIYLIDREGRIREIYNYTFFSVEQVLLDIRSIL